MKNFYFFTLLAASFILPSFCDAQIQGPYNPDTVFNTVLTNAKIWTNPMNAKDSDKMYATDSLGGLTVRSYYLEATGFNFSLSSNATVTGITAMVLGHDSGRSILQVFNYAYLVKDTVIQHDSILMAAHSDTDRWLTYGGCGSLWNGTWAYSDINSPNFGMAYFATSSFTTPIGYVKIYIDAVEMSVCYTVPTSTETLTQTSYAGSIYPNPSHGLVQLNYAGNYLIQINDLAGKEMYHSNLTGPQNIDLSFLPAGIYFAHITSGSNNEVRKFVIEK